MLVDVVLPHAASSEAAAALTVNSTRNWRRGRRRGPAEEVSSIVRSILMQLVAKEAVAIITHTPGMPCLPSRVPFGRPTRSVAAQMSSQGCLAPNGRYYGNRCVRRARRAFSAARCSE
jgi:hypothetical protein